MEIMWIAFGVICLALLVAVWPRKKSAYQFTEELPTIEMASEKVLTEAFANEASAVGEIDAQPRPKKALVAVLKRDQRSGKIMPDEIEYVGEYVGRYSKKHSIVQKPDGTLSRHGNDRLRVLF